MVGRWSLCGVVVGLVELVEVVFCVEVPGVCAMDWASLRVEGHVVGRLGGGSGRCFPTSVRFPAWLVMGADILYCLVDVGLGGSVVVRFLALWPGTWS